MGIDKTVINTTITRLKSEGLILQLTEKGRNNIFTAKSNIQGDIQVYESIIKKFIPTFLETGLDIDFTIEEFKIIEKLYGECK